MAEANQSTGGSAASPFRRRSLMERFQGGSCRRMGGVTEARLCAPIANQQLGRAVTICCTRFVLLFCVVVLTCLAQEPQSSPPFRVRVDRVNVGVTVTDSAGNFVEGLKREDFRVFDNGVEPPIPDFLYIYEPPHLLLLVEAGPAVFFLSKNHLFAADQLLTSLAANDRVAIASYTRTPQVVLGLT